MEWLGAYSKTVISFLLLQTLAEWVLPKGFEKQLQLLFGLGMIFTVAAPVMAVLGANPAPVAQALEDFLEETAWEGEVTVEGRPLWEEMYEEELEQQATKATGAQGAEILWEEESGQVQKVILEGADLTEEDGAQLAKDWGIAASQVTIRNEGGETP